MYFVFSQTFTTPVGTWFLDDVQIDATHEDRSASAQHPVPIGSVKRRAIAPGSSLASYFGFGADVYFTTPQSSVFNFGTGDVFLSMLVRSTDSGSRRWIDRSAPRIMLGQSSGGQLAASLGSTFVSNFVVNDGEVHHIAALRRGTGGAVEIWCDGVKQAVGTHTGSLTDSTGLLPFLIGKGTDFVNIGPDTDIAVPIISNYAPTDVEMGRLYESLMAMVNQGAYASPFNIGRGFPFIGYDPRAGAVVVDVEYDFIDSNHGRMFLLYDGTSLNHVQLRRTSTGVPVLDVNLDGVSQCSVSDTATYAPKVHKRSAVKYAEDDFRIIAEDGSGSSDSSGLVPGVTTLRYGVRFDGGFPTIGYIRSLAYFPGEISDADLDALVVA